MLKRSFAAVVDQKTRLLVLGSLPGEVSLAEGRYYAHPRNQFWRLIGAVIEADLERLDYAERLQALLAAHVGLWDVVESAARSGSLDSRIRRHTANRLAELAGDLPKLCAIGFNGGRSAAIGRKQLGAVQGIELIDLPSSSPAYTLNFEQKRLQWLRLRDWL
jgi:hypoxanthine-DNA glycosylase